MTSQQGVTLNLDQKAKLLALEVQRQNALRVLERRARHRRNVESLIIALVFCGVIGFVASVVVIAAGLIK